MAFGCDYTYVLNYGCSSYQGAYNFSYQRCCSYGWTEFGAWMMWVSFCLLFMVLMILAARARQRRRMMYMSQMQQNQQPGAIVI